VEVKIINLPTYIKVNPFLNDIMNTKDLLYSGYNRLSEINDTDWYEGNVLFIRPTCRDCGTKIKIYNHIEPDGTTPAVVGMTDYAYTPRGGSAQTTGGLVSFRHNGTLGQIVVFPENKEKMCAHI
jgi:ribosomal protein S27E